MATGIGSVGRKFGPALLVLVLALGVVIEQANALPFNEDMAYGQNMPAGSIMRGRVAGTVPMGALDYTVASREDALKLVNPEPGNKFSVENGKRLWQANCTPCHGNYVTENGKQVYKPGAVASQVPGPDLTAEMIAAKPDGHFYGYVYFGGIALMPAYGWKFSPTEHWDIVNYIRDVQKKAGSK